MVAHTFLVSRCSCVDCAFVDSTETSLVLRTYASFLRKLDSCKGSCTAISWRTAASIARRQPVPDTVAGDTGGTPAAGPGAVDWQWPAGAE